MGRDYSKNGCTVCKSRRKKCDEGKPVCLSCKRLGLACQYDKNAVISRRPRGIRDLQAHEYPVAPGDLWQPNVVTFANSDEEAVMSTAPSLCLRWFSPIAGDSAKDMSILYKLMVQSTVVRRAVVACFSSYLPYQESAQEQRLVTYGRAIQSMRESLKSLSSRSREDQFFFLTAINFMGFRSTISAYDHSEHSKHWKALAKLIKQASVVDPGTWSGLPLNIYILILESFVYHVQSNCMFVDNIEQWYEDWVASKAQQKLTSANPEDADHISRSPLHCGQSLLYHVSIHLSYALRTTTSASPSPRQLDSMQDAIERRLETIDQSFHKLHRSRQTKVIAQVMICQFRMLAYCNLLCIAALRQPRDETTLMDFNRAVKDALSEFTKMPNCSAVTYAPMVWAIYVLTCSLSDESDFHSFCDRLESLRPLMDSGLAVRAFAVLEEARAIRNPVLEDDAISRLVESPHEPTETTASINSEVQTFEKTEESQSRQIRDDEEKQRSTTGDEDTSSIVDKTGESPQNVLPPRNEPSTTPFREHREELSKLDRLPPTFILIQKCTK